MIKLNSSPISCKIFYPAPKIGDRYIDGNYEYSYGQSYIMKYGTSNWTPVDKQKGWGVRILDKNRTDYPSPLSMIQGKPVTSMACLFFISHVDTLNLIDWDTSSITNMDKMFFYSHATNLNLSFFDTSNVTNMDEMFSDSNVINLDLSSFNMSTVTNTENMFMDSSVKQLIARTESDADKYKASWGFPSTIRVSVC